MIILIMKAIDIHTPDQSWLNGSYPNIGAEINTSLSTVSLLNGEYFWQGSEADRVIADIHRIWIKQDTTVEQAISHWVSIFL